MLMCVFVRSKHICMDDKTTSPSTSRKDITRRISQVVFSMLMTAVLLFVPAGTLKWPMAWAYLGASILVMAINAFVLPKELIAERGKKKENVEKWDQQLTRLLLIPWMGLYLVAGLDWRFGWTPHLLLWISLTGLAVFILGTFLVTWAMLSNHYFSTAVRIQYERGHKVCDTGPYRYIRHPGYTGMMVYHLISPLIFSSWWAFIPAGLTALLFIVRTILEDRTLREKLEGYAAYAEKVVWRLMPGIW